MNRRSSTGFLGMMGLAPILFLLAGCRDDPPPPPKKAARKVIPLRVVMFVETGANLDSPPSETGGCKLTRTQVTTLVDELIAYGSAAAPGIVFTWDRNVQRLESDCLRLLGFPFPNCTSACLDLDAPDRCPRKLDLGWLAQNVVGHAGGGPAALQQADNYISTGCTINIYFVGNIRLLGAQVSGTTVIPNTLGVRDFFFVNDLALTDPFAYPDAARLSNRRTLSHEAVCHWLLQVTGHPTPTLENPCPANLCIGGSTLDAPACSSVYNGQRPDENLGQAQNRILNMVQNCGGSS